MAASANVVEFTAENWQKEVLESNVPVLVDFWAPWCVPCRHLLPIISNLADQFVGKAKIGKLNIDDAQDLASRYRISGIPHLLIFQGGVEKQRYAGLQQANVLATELHRLLGV